MTQTDESLIAGISIMTLKNVSNIMPNKCNIPGIVNIKHIFNDIFTEMFHKFEYHKEIQEITIKENEVKPFDDNISVKLLKDGSLQIIEHD